MKGMKHVVLGSALGFATALGHAQPWTLEEAGSNVHFVTVKNAVIAEAHQFLAFSGAVEAGQAEVVLDLASVETLIPIRNERMREMLFDVGAFPTATLRAAVPQAAFEALAPGAHLERRLEGTLTLRGKAIPLAFDVRASREAEGAVRVESLGPVMVSADQLGLGAGVEALREIAGLNSITPMVPVSFSLLFQAGEG